jgi:hypothetical protein
MLRIVLATLVAAVCWGQERQLTARELFYAAADPPAAKTAAPPAAKAAKAPPKPAQAKAPQKPAQTQAAKSAPAREQPPPPVDRGEENRLTLASHSSAAPLGLRYTVLKLVNGRMTEVSTDSVFRAGDRIQVSLEANGSGYLYIVHQGSSGTWKPLFPSPEVEDGDNRVERGRVYVMPPKARFYFDEQPGEEKLFVVLSRQPEPDLERLIYQLQDGARPSPATEPARRRPEAKLYAGLQIHDSVIGGMRVYARDLVIEKIDDEAAPPRDAPGRREKAVYVVNPSGGADSRVVADIRLTHK